MAWKESKASKVSHSEYRVASTEYPVLSIYLPVSAETSRYSLNSVLATRYYRRLHFDFHRLEQLETERRLCRQHDVLVAGQRPACGTRTSAHKSSNQSTFAAAGQSSDQRARAGATADELGRALAFAPQAARHRGGLDVVLRIVDGDRIQHQAQDSAPFKSPKRLRIGDGSGDRSALRDHHFALHLHRSFDRARKLVARVVS